MPFIILVMLLLFSGRVWAVGNEVVTTPLPDPATASFKTDGPNFWKNETPAVLGRYFPIDWVFSGGLHATAASCTSSAFSVEAFTKPTTPGSRSERVQAKSDGTGGSAAINYATV